jgi:hypothetical protein
MKTGPPEARYANYFEIGHTEAEFILDFGQAYEGEAMMHTRVVTGPGYAKEFSRLLCDSLARYESVHGQIDEQYGPEASRPGPRREYRDG